MKKLVVFATLAALAFIACGEKDPLPDPNETVEIVDSGKDAVSIVPVPNDGGYEFSYNAWVKVKTTKGSKSSEKKYSTKVTGSMPNVKKTIDVVDWNFGDIRTGMFYLYDHTNHDGNISIIDSVLVFHVGGVFDFQYELMFGAPVYDDGKNKLNMPHYRYTKVTDGGAPVIEDAETIPAEEAGYAYARKIVRHFITVELDGKSQKITSEVILRKKIQAGERYPVSTNISEKTAVPNENGHHVAVTLTTLYSDGEKVNETLEDDITARGKNVDLAIDGYWIEVAAKPETFAITDASVGEKRFQRSYSVVENMYRDEYKQELSFKIGGVAVKVPFYFENSRFDNGAFAEQVTDFSYDASTVKAENVKWTGPEEGWYDYTFDLCVKVGEFYARSKVTIPVLVTSEVSSG